MSDLEALVPVVAADLAQHIGAPSPTRDIESTAGLAVVLQSLDEAARADGCSDAERNAHASFVRCLSRSLREIGLRRVKGSQAAAILDRAVASQAAFLALMPPMGTA